ncbi:MULTISPECIES: hypothetical protein [unclassified Nocardioides]|uniref:hypothetical protein n=1 Tax=unclassified Nocardioides TaxID=2615069 RepID=UPI0007000ABF|nr:MULTISPECIES: hypothetical protein [unclassified Nocardioides]KRA38971.1 hypothetical protein ASD81_10425 [Nocardioides sp. Root614]KRA92930.1 hypothetical protein ASD84_10690 [Nocardioides sp. Root682]
MNRLTIVALTAAAVLGSAGGVGLAVATGGDDDSAGRDDVRTTSTADDRSDSGAIGPTDGPSSPVDEGGVLFYYADGAIHDGNQSVAVPTGVGTGDVVALQRVKGGWLFVEGAEDDSGDPLRIGTFIATDGTSWRIGEWRGLWDVSSERDRVVYGNGVSWKVAEFATRKASPLDVIDGPGEEHEYMVGSDTLPGISISGTGVLTGWLKDGDHLIADTDTDHWAHALLALPRDIDVPITSANGKYANGNTENPDYAPDNPVGSCLTGGRLDAVEQWWEQCERRAASTTPYSSDGEQLLVGIATGDGPSPSNLEVLDPTTGKLLHEIDPGKGTYLLGAEWASDGTVVTLTGLDSTPALSINRCRVDKGTCTPVLDVEGTVVLGSAT